jgi:hypothetical protein
MLLVGLFAISSLPGAVIDTTDPGTVAAFQAGATVNGFDSISGVTPMAITAYTNGVPVTAGATLFNQIPGVQFSVGGNPGSFQTEPVVFQLGGGISGDATSPANVLGPADMNGNTKFDGFIEVFFPVKVDRVGFWLNPALGTAVIVAKSNQIAFDPGGTEVQLESSGTLSAGHFVGFERATADIGGITIIATSSSGITIDDLTFRAGAVTTVPEPGTFTLGLAAAAGLFLLGSRRFKRRD